MSRVKHKVDSKKIKYPNTRIYPTFATEGQAEYEWQEIEQTNSGKN